MPESGGTAHPHGYKGYLGRALQAKFNIQEQNYHGSRGRTAQWWASAGWPDLQASLVNCPSTIIVSLGGNGTQGTSTLIEKIRTECPDVHILWSGAPPPGSKQVSRCDSRQQNNETIRAIIEATENASFVDPYDFIQCGHDDSGGDGIHLTTSTATAYVDEAFA